MIHSSIDKETILADLPYWASVSYLAKITIHERLLLEKCEHFVKSANRNRCFIASANGIQLLTIPIAGGRSHKQPYATTPIDNRLPWQRQHWHALVSAYSKSPFFEYYAPELEVIYKKPVEYLWNFNEALLLWLLKKIQLKPEVGFTQMYEKNVQCTDLRSSHGPERVTIPAYYQVFDNKHGFLHDMAGFDLLFNLGPQQAKRYLTELTGADQSF